MNNIEMINTSLMTEIRTEIPKRRRGEDEAKKIQFCKDFESVFLERLMSEMKNTVGNWGFEKDGATKQVEGIFWMYLARDMADKGGVGLWKQIYSQLTGREPDEQQANKTDVEI